MINYRKKIFPNKFYHIFNHAVAKEHLFRTDKNYYYFLEKYFYYISSIADTYAYCLMPNHFHLLVKFKTVEELSNILKVSDSSKSISYKLSQQFKNFFTSYSSSYNIMFERKGTLFEPRFKRRIVNTKEYFINLFNYIHQNPISHGFVKEKDDWKFSSYTSFYSEKNSLLKREDIYKLFNTKDEFDKIHNFRNAEKFAIKMELAY